MAKQDDGGQFAWFLAGLTIGIAGAILFAPRSGRETRDSIASAASKGRKLGRDVLRRGREAADEAKDAGKSVLTEFSLGNDRAARSEG